MGLCRRCSHLRVSFSCWWTHWFWVSSTSGVSSIETLSCSFGLAPSSRFVPSLSLYLQMHCLDNTSIYLCRPCTCLGFWWLLTWSSEAGECSPCSVCWIPPQDNFLLLHSRGFNELLGILVGHLYFFLAFKYPQDFGGRSFLQTPEFLWAFHFQSGVQLIHNEWQQCLSASGPAGVSSKVVTNGWLQISGIIIFLCWIPFIQLGGFVAKHTPVPHSYNSWNRVHDKCSNLSVSHP